MTNSDWNFDHDVVWTRAADLILGFGRKGASIASISDKFRGLFPTPIQWANLNQIHSKTVVRSDLSQYSGVEADAHYTFDRGLALIVKSADCLPVLIHGPATDKFPNGVIAAVHAGWRGVESEVVSHTIQKLKAEGVDCTSLNAVIGPHIRSKSFEVDVSVGSLLHAAATRAGYKKSDALFPVDELGHGSPKSFVHLDRIVIGQLMVEGLSKTAIEIFEEDGTAPDTKTDLRWSSYRRDGANAGRNYSFILRL
ncbi:MAG: polyphenol oxidase family protein [Bdellovibrionales bacterium]|nr:polyphenol oxidase family protein [Bdellovibrionales bacterium]